MFWLSVCRKWDSWSSLVWSRFVLKANLTYLRIYMCIRCIPALYTFSLVCWYTKCTFKQIVWCQPRIRRVVSIWIKVFIPHHWITEILIPSNFCDSTYTPPPPSIHIHTPRPKWRLLIQPQRILLLEGQQREAALGSGQDHLLMIDQTNLQGPQGTWWR